VQDTHQLNGGDHHAPKHPERAFGDRWCCWPSTGIGGWMMKRSIVALCCLLALPAMASATSASASTSTMSRSVSASHALCVKYARGHGKLILPEIVDCRIGVTFEGKYCPGGTQIVIVKVGKVNYSLRRGFRPVKVGSDKELARARHFCGVPEKPRSVITTTTTSLPPTTTTSPPTTVPPTTLPPPPPSTTVPVTAPPIVAPAGCSPIDDEGGCYEPGRVLPRR
jgi:hypothetical protein